MTPRVVFDTTSVVSALLFAKGRLAWLRRHWKAGACVPLLSTATATEITRVLAYPKFKLAREEREELLAEYLPYCEIVGVRTKCPMTCRDGNDQPFLDLAESGEADVLVSGDKDLLVLMERTRFAIETPEGYRRRVEETPS